MLLNIRDHAGNLDTVWMTLNTGETLTGTIVPSPKSKPNFTRLELTPNNFRTIDPLDIREWRFWEPTEVN